MWFQTRKRINMILIISRIIIRIMDITAGRIREFHCHLVSAAAITADIITVAVFVAVVSTAAGIVEKSACVQEFFPPNHSTALPMIFKMFGLK